MENKFIEFIKHNLGNGGIIYAIGNGGSAAEASHLIGELIGKFRKERPPIKAVALTDPAVITCIANDFGYENIYSRQLEALATQNDILVAFTTSGKSKNVIKALDVCRSKGCLTICFAGKYFEELTYLCDYLIGVEEETADRIQEVHIQYVHLLVQEIEKALYGE